MTGAEVRAVVRLATDRLNKKIRRMRKELRQLNRLQAAYKNGLRAGVVLYDMIVSPFCKKCGRNVRTHEETDT